MFELHQFLGIGHFNERACSLTSEYDAVKAKISSLTPEEYAKIQKEIDQIKKNDFTGVVVLSLSLSGTSQVRTTGFETSKVYILNLANMN